MKEYEVTLPIAGHAYLTVEAESEEAAIEKAMGLVTINEIEDWEALTQFHEGNVCHCPSPWEAEAECVGGEESEKEATQ
jgi:hypothetical protein